MVLAACAGPDVPDPSLGIEPVTSCKGAHCQQQADAGADQARDAGASASAAEAGAAAVDAGPVAHAENTCATAVDLGQMAGEPKYITVKPDEASAQAHCSAWAKIRVIEASNGIIPLEVKATLISPKTKKFDLFAYVDPDQDVTSCQKPTATSASTLSSVDTVNLKWGDSWSNDDSRTVMFQVKSRDGSCDPTSTWSLVVSSTSFQ
jgi:hypothetical protein